MTHHRRGASIAPPRPGGYDARVRTLLAACGGFLLAVLWMDLMFDVQVLAEPTGPAPLPASVLASLVGYYRRVTTDARPLTWLVAVVMAITVAGSVVEVARARAKHRAHVLALGLCAMPIGLAVVRVLPHAVRLGTAADPIEVQSELARGIFHDHVACLAAMLAFTGLQVVRGGRRPR